MPERPTAGTPTPGQKPRKAHDPAAAGDEAQKERDPHGKEPAADAAKEQPKGHPTDDRHRNETAADQ